MSKLEVISFNKQIFHAVSLSGGKDSTAMQIPSAMDTTNEEHILAGKEMMLCAKTQKP